MQNLCFRFFLFTLFISLNASFVLASSGSSGGNNSGYYDSQSVGNNSGYYDSDSGGNNSGYYDSDSGGNNSGYYDSDSDYDYDSNYDDGGKNRRRRSGRGKGGGFSSKGSSNYVGRGSNHSECDRICDWGSTYECDSCYGRRSRGDRRNNSDHCIDCGPKQS